MTWAEDTLLHVNGPQQAIPSLQSGEKRNVTCIHALVQLLVTRFPIFTDISWRWCFC